jgi:DnaJ family protein C protein 17
MRQQLAEEAANPKQSYVPEANQKAKLKVKWSKSSDSPYNRESLEKIFTKYGQVTAVVVNEKKGGSALIEFESASDAKMAANI